MSPIGQYIVSEHGSPDCLEWVEVAASSPGQAEVTLEHEAVGVDFIDTQLRRGETPFKAPTGIGFNAIGNVTAVGGGVAHLRTGQRVACVTPIPGSYATQRNVPAGRCVPLPDQAIDAKIAAGALFRGLTAWYLVTRLNPIGAGDCVLVHAAAGGVGHILCQWLRYLGAVVVPTAGSAEKVDFLKSRGFEHAVATSEDFVETVRAASAGRGADVVFDSVGHETIGRSIDSAARFGLVVSFGWASGDFETVSLPDLRSKGSLFVTRPTISHYTADDADLSDGVQTLFGLVDAGTLKIDVPDAYSLADAARAHSALEARRTRGSVVLTV